MSSPVLPPRPGRLDATVLLVAGSALICLALLVLMVVKLARYGFESFFDPALVLLIPHVSWHFALVVGLARGRRWTRMAMLVTFPLQIPLYGLFAAMLAPMVMQTIYVEALGTTGEDLRAWGLVLCLGGMLLAIVTPLLMLGPDIKAYLERPVER